MLEFFDSFSVTTLFIILCAVLLILIIIPNPLKLFATFMKQTVFGAMAMAFLNFALAPFSIFIGVNVVTILIVGLLGLPGLVSMYLIQVLFL